MNNTEECCPKFEVERWDKKEFHWKDKPFLTESIPTFFHIPFPPMIGSKVTKMMKAAQAADALEKDSRETLLLFADPTPFKSQLYLSVTKDLDQNPSISLSGKFLARVYDGPFNAVPRFISDMNAWLDEEGKKAQDYFVHYAYCPKCMKKYGHNYMILFARLDTWL